jgi:hypothetical protein
MLDSDFGAVILQIERTRVEPGLFDGLNALGSLQFMQQRQSQFSVGDDGSKTFRGSTSG